MNSDFLILDFDGVLMHSLDEVALTSFNTHTGQLATDLGVLPPGYLEVFRRNRFHVQPAADFVPFAAWCIEQGPHDPKRVLTNSEFDALLQSADSAAHAAAHRTNFYNTRRRFFEEQRAAWFAIHQVYEPLWSALKSSKRPWVILTHKNLEATLELCRHFDLPLSAERIFSGDGGGAKHEHIHDLISRYPAESYFYIDDSLRNLREVAASPTARPVKPALAAWGYCGPDDCAAATKLGWSVLRSPAELAAQLA